MLKRWLDDKGVKYETYMVDKNPIAAQNMVNLSGQIGVPFSTIEHEDGKVDMILGFDRPQFESVLAAR
jgi:glutaredoxin